MAHRRAHRVNQRKTNDPGGITAETTAPAASLPKQLLRRHRCRNHCFDGPIRPPARLDRPWLAGRRRHPSRADSRTLPAVSPEYGKFLLNMAGCNRRTG